MERKSIWTMIILIDNLSVFPQIPEPAHDFAVVAHKTFYLGLIKFLAPGPDLSFSKKTIRGRAFSLEPFRLFFLLNDIKGTEIEGLTWYSNCGHREKRGRINQLLEVTDEKREEEVHP
jgi:hypothetical protein